MEVLPTSFFDVYLFGPGVLLEGKFTSVSGLGTEVEYDTYLEGGSDFPRYFLKNVKQKVLSLEQGLMTVYDGASDLMMMTNLGMCVPLTGTIILRDSFGNLVREWTIIEAYLQKYEGPQLNSNQAAMAVNRIELIYNGCL